MIGQRSGTRTGYFRWWSILHFHSIGLVKAGWVVKKKGRWYLTNEGEESLHMGEIEHYLAASSAYRSWQAKNPKQQSDEIKDAIDEEGEATQETVTFDQIEQIADEGMRNHILAQNAYEFQDLVAALLRGMGYHTPFVAPRGKDGGIDIIAYRDPLGASSPRIKVQVKHRETTAGVKELRELMGILRKDGDVGMFVSTGGFSSDAKVAARDSPVHLELLDLEKFIELWQSFYNKLDDTDKARLPLRPVYFLAPSE